MKLGIIGGSGLYDIESLKNIEYKTITTPFGDPSDRYLLGKIKDTEICFLPRHGVGHRISPSGINHRANIYGMKMLGITHILSVSAVGSLKEELAPKDIVFIDQFFDRSRQSANHTFFNDGIVAHISFSDPICPEFSQFAYLQAQGIAQELSNTVKGAPKVVKGGTYVNIEGPAFSTKAESKFFCSCGWDVIGMTGIGEAKLAREAEICYCTAAMITDYDCWSPTHGNVTVQMVIETLNANIKTAKILVENIATNFNKLKRECSCKHALKDSIITVRKYLTKDIKKRLNPIIEHYI